MTNDGFDAGGSSGGASPGPAPGGAPGPAPGGAAPGPAPGATVANAGGTAAVADGAAAVATSAGSVATEVEAYVDRTLAEFKRMYQEYRYGSYCGPGGGGTPVDDIDTCCQTHDHAYAAVGQTGNNLSAMFSAAGVVATESADNAIVHCLNKTITGPTWHDPAAVVYREAAIAIFGARTAAAEYVRSQQGG